MTRTPNWWPHTVEAWIGVSDYFSYVDVSHAKNWKRLSHGQSNYNYQLSLPEDDQFFVQVVNFRNLDLLPQPEHRVRLLELAGLVNIKQWLVECYVDSLHLKIFKWVRTDNGSAYDLHEDPSRELTRQSGKKYAPVGAAKLEQDFDNNEFIASVAKFLVALHSIDKNQIETIDLPLLDIQRHLRKYFEKVERFKSKNVLLLDLDLGACLEISTSFEAGSVCHNDLSRPNLLWDQRDLKVVDWEYACISDPLFDLAGLIVNCQLNHSQEKIFLELYSAGLNRPVPRSKLADMKRLYRTLNVLWSTLQKSI